MIFEELNVNAIFVCCFLDWIYPYILDTKEIKNLKKILILKFMFSDNKIKVFINSGRGDLSI